MLLFFQFYFSIEYMRACMLLTESKHYCFRRKHPCNCRFHLFAIAIAMTIRAWKRRRLFPSNSFVVARCLTVHVPRLMLNDTNLLIRLLFMNGCRVKQVWCTMNLPSNNSHRAKTNRGVIICHIADHHRRFTHQTAFATTTTTTATVHARSAREKTKWND